MDALQEARVWQTGVWDKISDVYLREIDARFAPVVSHTIKRADLHSGEVVLDIGTGTGAAALEASQLVGPNGRVLGIDISPDMLILARRRAQASGAHNIESREGRAEEIPAADVSCDAVCASLCFQYVIDRATAAVECARVLKRSGRFVAAVWAGPDECDIVRFQATAGRFAPPPPVPGVGPGALADPTPFLEQLREAGIEARVETEVILFAFPNFDLAWEVLAGVTTASSRLKIWLNASPSSRIRRSLCGNCPRKSATEQDSAVTLAALWV